MTSDQRFFWFKRFIVLGLLVGMAITPFLWLNERDVPLVPIFDFLPSISPPFDFVLLGITALFLLLNLVLARQKFVAIALIPFLFVLIIQDFNRLQPWYWHYTWLLLLGVFYLIYYKQYRSREHLFQAIQLAFVALYIWAGIFKLNPNFVEKIIPAVYWPVTNYLVTFREMINMTGYAIPYIEIFIGLGLLYRKTRIFALLAGMGLHLAIIVLFSPYGLDYNDIILPWNAVLFIVLPILFFKYERSINLNELIKLPRKVKAALVVLLLLPALNFFGWYNKSLSFEVYSGNNFSRHLRWPNHLVKNIPASFEKYTYAFGDSVYIKTHKWTTAVMNCPPNPDPMSLKKMNDVVLKELQ